MTSSLGQELLLGQEPSNRRKYRTAFLQTDAPVTAAGDGVQLTDAPLGFKRLVQINAMLIRNDWVRIVGVGLGQRILVPDVGVLDAVEQHIHAPDPQHGAIEVEPVKSFGAEAGATRRRFEHRVANEAEFFDPAPECCVTRPAPIHRQRQCWHLLRKKNHPTRGKRRPWQFHQVPQYAATGPWQ